MKTNFQKVILVMICMLPSVNALASENNFCGDFAQISVVNHIANIKGSCGFDGLHWSPLVSTQWAWCEGQPDYEINQVLQLQQQKLSQCGRLDRRLSLSWEELPYHTKNRLFESLIHAIKADDLGSLKVFENEGVDLGFEWQMTQGGLLFWAITYQAPSVARYLIESKHANPNFSRNGGPNPIVNLLNQIPNVDYRLLNYLLQHGANPNHGGEDFTETSLPLTVAAANNDLQSVMVLLRYDADPNLYAYIPALMMAIDQGNFHIVEALLNAGASPNIGLNHLNCEKIAQEHLPGDYLPLDAATEKGNQQIISLLRKSGGRSSQQCRTGFR